MPTKEGVVLQATNGLYTVQGNGQTIHCTLRGNLKKEFEFNTSASVGRRVTRAKRPGASDVIAVGDRVRYAEPRPGGGVIEEILPRHSRFARSGFRGREQTMVCNLDQLFIVFACAEPRLDPWKLDRFLAAAEAAEIPPAVVANKRDRATEEEYEAAFEPFRALGYEVLPTCAKTSEGVETLRDRMKDKISAFVGPSGVGKSTLLNLVQPGLNIRTSEVGLVTFKGRHTTTSSQLHPLRFGGWVADTPGLRDFEVLQMSREELAHCFPDLVPHLGQCRFDNCRHESEPGCALKAAVSSGDVSERRYQSFLTISSEAEAAGRPRPY